MVYEASRTVSFTLPKIKKNKLINVKKYVMQDLINSIDIDTGFDFMVCETVIKNNLFEKY